MVVGHLTGNVGVVAEVFGCFGKALDVELVVLNGTCKSVVEFGQVVLFVVFGERYVCAFHLDTQERNFVIARAAMTTEELRPDYVKSAEFVSFTLRVDLAVVDDMHCGTFRVFGDSTSVAM